MRAIVQANYGPPSNLRLMEVDRPQPAADEVLVEVHAASVNPDVWHAVTGIPFLLRLMGAGVRRPHRTIPGSDLAGRVVEVGSAVTRFRPGDEVFGECLQKMQWANGGSWAEYATAHESALAHKPAGITFEQAASVATAGLITMWNLDLGQLVQPGQRVLVNGAGGNVGTTAVQVAKARGAVVTAVDRTGKLGMLTSLGADHVIDFTQEDFTQGDTEYDLIFDVPGNHAYSRCKRVLADSGQYILIAHDDFGRQGRRTFGSIPKFLWLVARSFLDGRLARQTAQFPSKQSAMEELAWLLEQRQLTPVIDTVFPLAKAGEAMDYMVRGEGIGRIVINCRA